MKARKTPPVITLTTDFGTRDHYVSVLKGVILGITPNAVIVDISHEVEPFQIMQAAYILRHALPHFPPETIHLAVVDPGVGSSRRILLAGYQGQLVVAPDNGLITLLHHDFAAEAMHVVENRKFFLPNVSTTFHGRDIMAPVAAHLAAGTPPHEFGRTTDHVEVLDVALKATCEQQRLIGQALYADRFGNIVTNIDHSQLTALKGQATSLEVLVNDEPIGAVQNTFADVSPESPVAYVGSCGLIEIGVNLGSALQRFGPLSQVCVIVRGAGAGLSGC